MFLESALKGIAAMTVAVEKPRKSYSLAVSRVKEIAEILTAKLPRFGKIRKVRRQAKVAKEARKVLISLEKG